MAASYIQFSLLIGQTIGRLCGRVTWRNRREILLSLFTEHHALSFFFFPRPFVIIAILGTMKRFSFLTRFPDNSTYNYSTIISLLLAYSGNCIVITRLVFPNARWIERFNVRENKEITSYGLVNNRLLGSSFLRVFSPFFEN